jgi:hypothetical protein
MEGKIDARAFEVNDQTEVTSLEFSYSTDWGRPFER